SEYFFTIITVIVVLILIGIGLLICIGNAWKLLNKKFNKWRKRICIHAPYEIDNETGSWVKISLRQMTNFLNDNRINFILEKKESSITKYPIVVNPYGGVYPEADLSSL